MNAIDIIEKYGLSVRRIPLTVTSCFDVRHYEQHKKAFAKDASVIISEPFTHTYNSGVNRQFFREQRTPENAGYWMCKQVENTCSMVRWDKKTDNLAPTLEESVQKWHNQHTKGA